jgi:cytosine/creatinine deaminase
VDPFINAAYQQALKSYQEGGIPVGSVLVFQNQIVGAGHNQRIQRGSVVLHGEMDALENAGRRNASFYRQATLYTTLSPCPMCSGTILLYGIPRVVIGENETFMGEEEWLRERGVEVVVLNDQRCHELMNRFIRERPEDWYEDIGV